MTTLFGNNPTFNSFHFSGANTLNQESIAAVAITAPGRITDLNVFWDGNGTGVAGNNMLWHGGGAIFIESATYSSGVGGQVAGGQHLHTTSHSTFFNSSESVFIGFFRDKTASSVISLNTAGADGFTQTTPSNAPSSVVGHVNFVSQYGALGKGEMRAYGHYGVFSSFVRRGSVWTSAPIFVNRSDVPVGASVYVFRNGNWIPVASAPPDQWHEPREQRILIVWPDGGWEYGIIREDHSVLFGNYDPRNQSPEPIYELVAA